jgi:hypothetical protein
MSNTTYQCKCAQKLSRAEESLRTKGKNNRGLQSQYFAAAEVKRVVLEHFRECPGCQAEEAGNIGAVVA